MAIVGLFLFFKKQHAETCLVVNFPQLTIAVSIKLTIIIKIKYSRLCIIIVFINIP